MAWQLRTRKKRRRWPLVLAGLVVAFTVFGFLVLPPIVKTQLERRLSQALHRQVLVGHVKINPYTLAVTIEDFEVRERDGRGTFLAWERLYVNFEVLSFVSAQWRFHEIRLDGPRGRVIVNPDGSLNFSDLLTQASPAEAAAQPATPTKAVRIAWLALNNARLEFEDRSRPQPFATTLGPVGFAVKDFYTVGGEQAPYSFDAVTELGERFSWRGWMLAAPFRSGGELTLGGLVLKKYAPYYAEKLGVDLADGVLSVRGRYEVNFGATNRALRLTEGSVALRNLKLTERSTGAPLLELPAAEIGGVTADGLTLRTSVARVAIEGGRLRLRREADGTLNLLSLAAPAPAPAPAPSAPAAANPATRPDLSVKEIAVKDFAVDVQDLGASRPAVLGLGGLQVSLRDFTLSPGAKFPVDVAFGWQPQGSVKVAGEVALSPLAADLQLDAVELALLPLSPYLEEFVNARLSQGSLTVRGRAALAPAPAGPAVRFTGGVRLAQLGLVDAARAEPLAGLGELALNGLKVETVPALAVAVEEVVLAAPYARVVRERDGALNLARLARPAPPAPAGSPAAAAANSARPAIEVARVTLNDGEFSFADRSLSPEVRLVVSPFGGTLTELSSAHPGKGAIDLSASINGSGPLRVSGRFDPFAENPSVDAKVDLRGLDLTAFSPYSGKYAGFALARGRLTMDLGAKFADRRVDLANVVTLDQFTFGAPTNSPDATKLPVRLGVALLKDTSGRIILDLPVQGSLDDPEFRIGRVVLRVLTNLLTKAAVSPFTLLGSMFGGGGEELGWQEFAPGAVALTDAARGKLATVAKALLARPALSVDIAGGFDAAADPHALRHARIQERIRRQVWEQRHAADPNIDPPEKLAITPEDFAAEVKRTFDRQFPPGTQFGTPLPPPPLVVPPAPRKSGNLLARFVDAITFKQSREEKAFLEAQRQQQADYVKQAEAVVAAGLPLDEMIGRLAQAEEISPDDLRALAASRAQAVRDYLLQAGVAADRLFLHEAPADPAAGAEAVQGPRVRLTLQ